MKNLKLSTKILLVSIFVLLVFSLASFGILFRALSNQASREMDQLLHNEILALSSLVNSTIGGDGFEFEMHSKFLSQYHQRNPNGFFRFVDPKKKEVLKESLNAPAISCNPGPSNMDVRVGDQDFRIETLTFHPEFDAETETSLPASTRELCLVIGLNKAPYWNVVSETLLASIPILIFIVILLVIALLFLIRGLTKDLLALTSALKTANFGGTHAFPTLTKATTEEVKAIVEVLEDLHKQAAEVYREMWLFMGRAAHQIKTPVTAMQATLDVLLRKDRSKEELLAGLEDVKSAASLLSVLTKKLILSSRISYQESPQKENVNLDQFFTELVGLFRSQADERGVRIVMGTTSAVSALGNRALMSDIFSNLIENAILYSPTAKGATVTIAWLVVGEKISIEVSDEGEGFPKVVIEALFQPFVRGDERRVAGSGLGLSIAKKSAQLLNGEIALKSSTQNGSKVVVTLPTVP